MLPAFMLLFNFAGLSRLSGSYSLVRPASCAAVRVSIVVWQIQIKTH